LTDPPEDALPEDLDVTAVRVRYTFPDVKRRRIAGVLYLALAGLCLVAWMAAGNEAVLVNAGTLGVAITLVVIGMYHVTTSWPLRIRDEEALIAAGAEVGFPVGHASAQLGWRGLRSRPTWRILVYSGEEPPKNRALVLVDAVDGRVLSHFVEENPEDWSGLQ
jgi:hypothetical protein